MASDLDAAGVPDDVRSYEFDPGGPERTRRGRSAGPDENGVQDARGHRG